MEIRVDDLTGPEIAELLSAHLEHGNANSPPESVHALDLDGLRHPDITFWSVWQDGSLLGCGALRELSPDQGELKSMHTARQHRGKGVARLMVEHILAEAKKRGYRQVSLETGSMEAFAPARALYSRFGFEECPPFGSYTLDPHSVFMTRGLAA
ncbi:MULTISPECIES: GNAT family N-acetyltransferase [Nisaea]|uniref:GNAT family N-acetyltransferase n=1 Tax=Nisaea TaxID=390876 RepID=UPI0004077F7D|nr:MULTISPECIES: GNAT family N-acetyltransferase [Nisaea]